MLGNCSRFQPSPDIHDVGVGFLSTLFATSACDRRVTPPQLLEQALKETGVFSSPCFAFENWPFCGASAMACWKNESCGECLSSVVAAASSAHSTKRSGYETSKCSNLNPVSIDTDTLPADMRNPNNTLWDTATDCYLGECTYLKWACSMQPQCGSCLASLVAGDISTAARLCPVESENSDGFMLLLRVLRRYVNPVSSSDFVIQSHLTACLSASTLFLILFRQNLSLILNATLDAPSSLHGRATF